MVTGEAEINNANSHGEPKSVQINYLKIETIECSKCGLKYLALAFTSVTRIRCGLVKKLWLIN